MARKLGSKDKTKRKSRSLLVKSALLGGSTALGGYVGGKDSKVNYLMKNNLKRTNKLWDAQGWKKEFPDSWKDVLNDMKGKPGKSYAKEQLKIMESIANYFGSGSRNNRFPKTNTRRLNKLNKIRNVSIGKGALIGLGVGSALLGANELRKRMSKKK
jgi:hypothetical protein